MPSGRLTKKEINRYNKKELMKIFKDNGIACNSKTSKTSLVAEVLKNKSLRGSLEVKAKRKMSDKQKANLSKFRFKKSSITPEQDDSAVIQKPKAVASREAVASKSKTVVDPTAGNKNEPAPPSLKQNPSNTNQGKTVAETAPKMKMQPKGSVAKLTDGKQKITDFKTGERKGGKVSELQITSEKQFRDKASLSAERLHQGLGGTVFDANRMENLDSHTIRLTNRTSINSKRESVAKAELNAGQNKSSDNLDRRIFNSVTNKNKKKIALAEQRAKGHEERKFDAELDEAGEDLEPTENLTNEEKLKMLLSLQSSLRAGIITQQEYENELRKFQQRSEEQSRVIPSQSQRDIRLEQIRKRLKEINDGKKKA